ncbi:MAG TPA: ABC transporter permease [Spirochaetota bacterium]|nr:ABC transporter permease [Spirochaetota bacterium]HPV41799.1 ABC transporter permease [Spirochaetota bacterium]
MKPFIRPKVLISMIKKEFAQVLRDIRMRGVVFGPPIIMIVIFGYAINLDVNTVNLAVLDEDKTLISRGLIEKFTGSGYFKLHSYLYSNKDLTPLMDQGKVEAFIHLRRDLSKNLKTGKVSEIQVIIDGTDSNRGAIITAYVNEIMQGFFMEEYLGRIKAQILYRMSGLPGAQAGETAGMVMPRGIRILDRAYFNPTLLSKNYFLPGVIGFIVSLITVMLTSMSIVKERESGTMEQIVVSPIRPMEFIMGKTIPFAIIGFIDMLIVSIITIFWFGVPFKGNILFLYFAAFFYILCSLAVGIFISTISKTQQQAMMSFFLYFIPAILFSGFAFPIYAMPETIQFITYFNPLMYFIVIIRGVFLKGVGITVLWKELLVLIIIGVALLNLSARRLSRRME